MTRAAPGPSLPEQARGRPSRAPARFSSAFSPEVAMQLSRRQIYAYVAVAAVVLAVGVRYVVLPKAAGPAGGEPLVLAAVSPPPASPAAATSPSEAADVVVYVCGAVKSPGVVRVPAGARAVSYTHLRAHETRHDLVCRLLLE